MRITKARKAAIVDMLNDFDPSPTVAASVEAWVVIVALPEYDSEATDAADPNFQSHMFVMRDGTVVEWSRAERVWKLR